MLLALSGSITKVIGNLYYKYNIYVNNLTIFYLSYRGFYILTADILSCGKKYMAMVHVGHVARPM